MAHGEGCSCCMAGSVAVESLEEMDFARSLAGAAHTGDTKRMKELLEKGACVNGDAGASHTPLHYAARNGHLAACRLLLKHGADVNARTKAGKATSLHRAAYEGHEEIVKLLISRGGEIEAVDADGHTPVDKAIVGNKNANLVRYLLNNS